MKKNSIRTIIILAITAILFSVISFVAPFEKNAIFTLSYIFGLISIIAQVYILYSAFCKGGELKSTLYGFPIARLGVIYASTQLALSIIFMIASPWIPVWVAVILFAIILCATAVGIISTEAVRDEIVRQDDVIKVDVASLRSLQSKSDFLVTQCEDNDLKNKLQALADEFRYSDPVSKEETSQIETELEAIYDELSNAVVENDSESIGILIKKASAKLAERNRICKLSK